MLRLLLLVALLFALLLVLRALRILFVLVSARRGRPGGSSPIEEGEMVRDPICGTWIDRRLALPGRRGGEWIPVCSEKCRNQLEAQ